MEVMVISITFKMLVHMTEVVELEADWLCISKVIVHTAGHLRRMVATVVQMVVLQVALELYFFTIVYIVIAH
jgi:hypothetical protein